MALSLDDMCPVLGSLGSISYFVQKAQDLSLALSVAEEDVEEVEEKKVYTLKKEEEGFNVRIENGVYIVDGPAIEKILRRANLEDNESLYYFQKSIRFLGIEDALKAKGIKEGDTVKFMDWEMEWFD